MSETEERENSQRERQTEQSREESWSPKVERPRQGSQDRSEFVDVLAPGWNLSRRVV